MRTIWEDILVAVLVLLILPVAIVLLLAIGWTTSILIPVFLPFFILLFLFQMRRKGKPKVRAGKVRLIKMPRVRINGQDISILQLLFSIVFTILIVVGFCYLLLILPSGLSALILFCMIGYSVGARIKGVKK